MPTSPRRARIFVSHAWLDKTWCERFVELLSDAGADVWWDVGSLHKGLIPEEVSKQIEERPIFITVLTPDSVDRPWMKTEYSAALMLYNERPEEQRVIWPVVAKKCHVPAVLKPHRGVQGSSDVTPEQAAEETIRALEITPASRARAPKQPKPRTPDEALTRGKALLEQGRPSEALPLFEMALALAQTSGNKQQAAAACVGKGHALEATERDDEALAAYADATQLAADYAQGWARRGSLLGQHGRYEEALADLDRAISLKLDYPAVWLNRSTVLRRMGEPNRALESAQRALEIDPDYGPALMIKADALDELGQLDAALGTYDAALAAPHAPGSPTTVPAQWQVVAHGNRGNTLLKLNCSEAAYAAFERAVTLDPLYAHAWHGKGLTLWRLKRYAEAVQAFDQALATATDPDVQAGVWNGKGAALLALEQPVEAENAYLRALDFKPDDGGSLRGLGDSRRARSDHAGALDAYLSAINSHHLDPGAVAEVWSDIGALHIVRGEPANALAAFDHGIAADPSVARCWFNKSALLEHLGRQSEAAAVRQRFAENLAAREYEKMVATPGVKQFVLLNQTG